MPSPFPGMNPFLEREYTWKDFHDTLLFFIRGNLVPQVRPSFIVQIGEYLFVHEPSAEQRLLLGHADVSLSCNKDGGSQTATATNVSPARIRLPAVDIEEHLFLEILDCENLELVTVVEMLSPSNKKPRADREHYLAKRANLLHSAAHFVEIDLLRAWPRMPMEPAHDCDYCITVSRVEDRPEANFWPLGLRDALPVIPIPLRPPRADASIDLQALLHQAYDSASYGDYLYGGTPFPPLSPDDAAWARSLISVPS
ncbi:MAG: DUF4058 family protein [Planctomycetes bacterium]|nr:DUF4058 family protein [Planctomycetota bacterium]